MVHKKFFFKYWLLNYVNIWWFDDIILYEVRYKNNTNSFKVQNPVHQVDQIQVSKKVVWIEGFVNVNDNKNCNKIFTKVIYNLNKYNIDPFDKVNIGKQAMSNIL